MNPEKLARLAAQVRTGEKGSVRRVKKKAHKNVAVDEKKLKASLKRLGVNDIPGIEEVNLFKDDGTVIHFVNPKVQASIAANVSGTYVISGTAETKKLQDLLPGIINQLGPDNLANLKEIAKQFTKEDKSGAAADDEIPELVDNFDAVAAENKPAAAAKSAESKPTEQSKPAEGSQPVAEESKPAEENKPVAEESKPVAEESKPVAEESKPVAEESKPVADDAK